MRKFTVSFAMTGLLILMMLTVKSFAQYTTIEGAKDYINDRLSHSMIQKVDSAGTVTISAPGEKIKFRLQDVSFNYNGGNNDDRVRVYCDNCIEHYEHKELSEKTSRQSFLCESEKEAYEVINAFRYLKKMTASNKKGVMTYGKKLKVIDTTFGTKSIGEAIDFINDNLSFSMVMGINDEGLMTINAPDEVFEIDLREAEFGYNDLEDASKVRIYGNFCIDVKNIHGKKEYLSRKSFQTPGRVKAFKVITILYYLKCTYNNTDPSTLSILKNLGKTRTEAYKNTTEAIDFINSRLSYSIIMGIDNSGNLSINSPDNIYAFNIHDVKMSKTDHSNLSTEWFSIPYKLEYTPGVLMECQDCIKQYDAPGTFHTMREQVFQCGSMTEVKDVLKAFAYIQALVKK